MRSVRLETERVLWGRFVEEKRVNSRLAVRSRTFSGSLARSTGVNECCACLFVDCLKVDHELGGIVLGVGEDFRTKKSNDVIRNNLFGLGREIVIVDAEE